MSGNWERIIAEDDDEGYVSIVRMHLATEDRADFSLWIQHRITGEGYAVALTPDGARDIAAKLLAWADNPDGEQ